MSDDYNSNLHKHLQINNEEAMIALGAKLAKWVSLGAIIYLDGDLGAGKTTLVRGFLRALAHHGVVKSPTFTVVEPYFIDNRIFYNYNKLDANAKIEDDKKSLTEAIKIYHFDLYRLEDPEELEYLGIRDYLDGQAISLIEWPEKGYGVLSAADLQINIQHQGQGRQLELIACSDDGVAILSHLLVS